jgi:hypothetical protein
MLKTWKVNCLIHDDDDDDNLIWGTQYDIYYTNYLPRKHRFINNQEYFTLGTGPYMGHSVKPLRLFLAKNMAAR